jgi:steroid delta-isomerase-like uncharacterized protein
MLTPKQVLTKWVDAFNSHDAAAAAALFHETSTNIQLPAGKSADGRQAALDHFPALFLAFPDCRTQINCVFEDGEWAILEWTLSGTFLGEFAGHPPTGRSFTLHGCEFFQVADGKIRFQRGYWDRATWFGQIGLPLE